MKDDALLIDEVLAGEQSAYETLVRKYQDRLFNSLLHVTGSREEAEDVVQDAFVQAYVKLDTFQGASAFYTWLYRIAFNVAISRGRKRRPEVSVEAMRDAAGIEPMDDLDSPPEALVRLESVQLVRSAIGRLTDEHRAILTLREMEGLCYEEIADVLDLPVGSVRSRLHRARLQLRDELKEVFQPT